MKKIVFIFTTFLMLGVNLVAEVQSTNDFPVEESGNLKNNIGKEIQEANAMEEKSELVELAKNHFGELSEAEVKFFTATAKGEYWDYKSGSKEANNPENADEWGDERVLRASVIEWLCTDRNASQFITHKGIGVTGVRIDGQLNLQFAQMDFPIIFFKSVFKENIILQHSKLKYLNLSGTYTKAIIADGLEVEGGVCLRNGFKAEGEVRLSGAEIGGNLSCVNGKFINPNATALNADRLKVNGSVLLRNGFKAEGEVILLGAEIEGDLDCINSEFINPNATALGADGLKVKGAVFLKDGCKVEGAVRLLGAEIGKNLECDKSEFINPKANALHADGLKVNGGVFLRNGFKAEGEVRLLGAEIGGDLVCDKSEFINPNATALNADGLKVIGNVFLSNGFKAEGRIGLVGAIINGHFVYTGVKSPEGAELDLRSAKIGVLFDEEKSWPKEGNLYLHGTVYEEIFQESPRDAKRRIKWLTLNGGEGFSPQPYEQLASVLKRSGHEKDATEVLITKNKDFAELGAELSKTQWLWYKVLGPMIGYGYRPLKAFVPILIFVVLGWAVFWSGYQRGVMSPMAEDHPVFQPLVYSIDMFLPVVNLYQGNYWLPDASKVWFECKSVKISSWWLLGYLRIHIMAGWVFTTLLLGGLTGLIRT